ncbi:MAG: IPT/TIG domain-containing protein [Planctomycetes bacterium]|nr:IPT/TIG domain-containing protein [Planctomycetota bacterium]
MHTLRLFGAAAALLCAFALPANSQSIDSLSTTEGTTGTVVTLNGSGFGTKRPKVELVTEDKKAKGSALKVLEYSDTSLTVLIKKAAAGEYGLRVRPKGKGIEPALAADTFTIRTITDVAADVMAADPGEEVLVTASFMGTKRGKVKVGGQKASVKSWVPIDEGLEGGQSGFFNLKLPKKLANGTYAIEITTKVGSVTIPDFITIENSTVGQPKPGKVSFTCKVSGKAFKASSPDQLKWATACPAGCTTSWAATQISSNPRSFFINVLYDAFTGNAATLSGSQLLSVSYAEGAYPNQTSYIAGNGFVIEITGKAGDQLIGKFSGPMNKVGGPGAASVTITDGNFVLDRAF